MIIPGWPAPTTKDVELFQANNGLEVDGIVGPKTRAAADKPIKERGPFTHLAHHPVKVNGDLQARKVAQMFLCRYSMAWVLPSVPPMLALLDLLSSGWKTGRYLSTQDGLTFGFRRYAARTLRRFIDENPAEFRRHLGAYNLHRTRTTLADAPNNGGLGADPAIRLGMIEAARDWGIFELQVGDACDWIKRALKPYPRWRDARTIALAVRASNSSPRWVKGAPQDDADAWDYLVASYSKHKRGPSRIKRICKEIPEGTKWR